MKSEQIRIIIADDHQMIRETWKLVLEQNESFTIVAECRNGNEAIQAAIKLQPDIILMDVNMSPVNGFEATKKIAKQAPNVRVIGISIHNQPAYAENMLQMGAKGYVTKNSTKDEMFRAITEVHNGKEYVCKEVKDKMNK